MKKNKKIKRYTNDNLGWNREINEQEYLDKEINILQGKIDLVNEEIEILQILCKKDYIFIQPSRGMYVKNDYFPPEKARVWAKENNYSYFKTFKESGELWIKEGKDG